VDSAAWRWIAAAEWAFWLAAVLALRIKIPVIHRIAAPASALLVLNVAAVAGLYKFLFTAGPLWKIWSVSGKPADSPISLETKQGRA
jgi:hypothetical protein